MIIKNKRVLILGGDLRIVFMANELSANNDVYVYGLQSEKLNRNIFNFEPSNEEFDLVIGPIPTTRDERYLFAPTTNERIILEELFGKIKMKIFVGCKLEEEFINILETHQIPYFDILERDDFAIANALPTAEGAIQIAMENTTGTLSGSNCLVLGYGRCGKILAHKLQGIGAQVTVEARKTKDLEYIESYGFTPLHLDGLNDRMKDYDIIFNTIPHMILNEERLKKIKVDSLIIDLASKPGGTDFEYAYKRGIKAILALGLPGKCAPKTAGQIIIRCIENILNENHLFSI